MISLADRAIPVHTEGITAPAPLVLRYWGDDPEPDDPNPNQDDSAWMAEQRGTWDATTAVQEPRLPFADWLDVQASLYRLSGTTAALWLADQIDRLAAEARWLHASNPDHFEDRRATIERDYQERRAQAVGA